MAVICCHCERIFMLWLINASMLIDFDHVDAYIVYYPWSQFITHTLSMSDEVSYISRIVNNASFIQ